MLNTGRLCNSRDSKKYYISTGRKIQIWNIKPMKNTIDKRKQHNKYKFAEQILGV